MRTFPGHFDEIHSTECSFGEPILAADSLRVPAPRIVLLGDHPLCWGNDLWVCRGALVFLGARRSRRRLIGYVGDPKAPVSFEPEVEIVDLSGPVDETLETFRFEGFSIPRNAWILEWTIEARSFALEVDDGTAPTEGSARWTRAPRPD
jgi:hypothetical protein